MVCFICKSNHKPWLTLDLVNACKKRNGLCKVFFKCRSKEAETKYKVYKNKLITIIRFSEKQYYDNKLVEYKSNLKSTWQLLCEITMRKKKSYKWPHEFYSSGQMVSNKKAISDGFNNFFTNIGSMFCTQKWTLS